MCYLFVFTVQILYISIVEKLVINLYSSCEFVFINCFFKVAVSKKLKTDCSNSVGW